MGTTSNLIQTSHNALLGPGFMLTWAKEYFEHTALGITRGRPGEPVVMELEASWRLTTPNCACGSMSSTLHESRNDSPLREPVLPRGRKTLRRHSQVLQVVAHQFQKHLRPCLVYNFGTIQKEDSPSHQTCGTCMKY